jgi:hypothetical protein
MRRYLEQGILPGDFLRAVLRNDLVNAMERADDECAAAMRDIAQFLELEVPYLAWGSEEKVQAWADLRKAFRFGSRPQATI